MKLVKTCYYFCPPWIRNFVFVIDKIFNIELLLLEFVDIYFMLLVLLLR